MSRMLATWGRLTTKEQPVQTPWGGSRPGRFGELRGQGGWRGASGVGMWPESLLGHVGHRKDLGFEPESMRSRPGC